MRAHGSLDCYKNGLEIYFYGGRNLMWLVLLLKDKHLCFEMNIDYRSILYIMSI